MGKTTVVRLLEQQEGEEIETLIPRLFKEQQSVRKVAARLGVNPRTVKQWMDRLGLEVQRTVIKGG